MALTGLQLRCALSQTVAYTVTAPSGGYDGGEIILVGDNGLSGVVARSADAGDSVAVIVEAESILVPCETATTGDYAQGDKVYADATANQVTTETSGTQPCGTVLESASVGATTVLVRWDGKLGLFN